MTLVDNRRQFGSSVETEGRGRPRRQSCYRFHSAIKPVGVLLVFTADIKEGNYRVALDGFKSSVVVQIDFGSIKVQFHGTLSNASRSHSQYFCTDPIILQDSQHISCFFNVHKSLGLGPKKYVAVCFQCAANIRVSR